MHNDRPHDTTAVFTGIFATIGFTMLLLSFGGALGIGVPEGTAGGALDTEFGTWAFVSAVGGTFLGCLVGGLTSVRRNLSSAIGYGIAAVCGALVLGAVLGVFGVAGMIGGALAFTGTEGGAVVVTAIGWDGWALFVALATSFVAAVGGWMTGLAIQPRRSRARVIEEHRFVRPNVRTTERTRSGNGAGVM